MTKERKTFCIWYKRTLKKTGRPIMVTEVVNKKTIKEYQVDEVNIKNCDIEMKFNNPNTPRDPIYCGATTVLLVYPRNNVTIEDICNIGIE